MCLVCCMQALDAWGFTVCSRRSLCTEDVNLLSMFVFGVSYVDLFCVWLLSALWVHFYFSTRSMLWLVSTVKMMDISIRHKSNRQQLHNHLINLSCEKEEEEEDEESFCISALCCPRGVKCLSFLLPHPRSLSSSLLRDSSSMTSSHSY